MLHPPSTFASCASHMFKSWLEAWLTNKNHAIAICCIKLGVLPCQHCFGENLCKAVIVGLHGLWHDCLLFTKLERWIFYLWLLSFFCLEVILFYLVVLVLVVSIDCIPVGCVERIIIFVVCSGWHLKFGESSLFSNSMEPEYRIQHTSSHSGDLFIFQ